MVTGLRNLPSRVDNDDEPPGEVEYMPDEALAEPQESPILYYDPARFPEPADVDRLEWQMRSRSPTDHGRDWQVRPVLRESLKHWSPFSNGRVERRFLVRGYVSTSDDLPVTKGTPTYTVQQLESLRALQHAIVVAEAVIKAVKGRLGRARPAWLQSKPVEILAPVSGRRSSLMWDREQKATIPTMRNRKVPLIVHDGLAFGCSDFRTARTIIASGYHSADITGNDGRGALHERQREPDGRFQALIARELGSADPALLPGIALWACQRVAFCRIALEEARWHQSPPRRQAIARRFTKIRLDDALDMGFREWTKTKRTARTQARRKGVILRSEPLWASEKFLQRRNEGDPALADEVEVSAFRVAREEADDKIRTEIGKLYDHFGWEPPEICRLDYCLRRCVERAYLGSYVPPIADNWDEPRRDLQDIAAWLGELRRWGRAVLDANLAFVLDRVLRGCPEEEYEQEFESAAGQAAIAYLKSLMPPTFWSDIDAALDAVIAGGPAVPILYDGTPVGPVWHPSESFGMAAPVVVQGPVLDFPAAEAAWWTDRAAGLGRDGLLIRPPNDDKKPKSRVSKALSGKT